MAKWVPDSNLDLQLQDIDDADEQAVCNAQPSDFFDAHYPDMWVADTVYSAGDCVRPPTANNFIYECTVGGTSGSSEPAWSITDQATFSDNTVTWRAHESVCLANCDIDPGDKSIADNPTGPEYGRALTIAEISGSICHRSGTVSHTAFLDKTNQLLKAVTTAETDTAGDNDIESGKAVIFQSVRFVSPDP